MPDVIMPDQNVSDKIRKNIHGKLLVWANVLLFYTITLKMVDQSWPSLYVVLPWLFARLN